MESSGFSLYKICLQIKIIFFLPLWFGRLVLFFLSDLAMTSNTTLNQSSEHGDPCVVPGPRGKAFSLSLWSMMLAVGLFPMASVMLSTFPLCPLIDSFYHGWMSNFVKWFFICWDDYDFNPPWCWCVVSYRFVDVEPFLHPWNKSYAIMVYDPCIILLNLFG